MRLKGKPAGAEPAGADGSKAVWMVDYSNYTTPRRRCLPPKENALLKLDVVEQRLQAARAIGDDDSWARYYLCWLKLYGVAFGAEVSDV